MDDGGLSIPGITAAGGAFLIAGGNVNFTSAGVFSASAIGSNGQNGSSGANNGYPSQTAGNGGNGGNGGNAAGGGIFLDGGNLTLTNFTGAYDKAEGGAGGDGGKGGYGFSVTSFGEFITAPYHGNGGNGGDGGYGGFGAGGAIFVDSGTLTINNSSLYGNEAIGGAGGAGGIGGRAGIYGATLTLRAGNGGNGGSAGPAGGGAIFIQSGNVAVTVAGIYDNEAVGGAGGNGGRGGTGMFGANGFTMEEIYGGGTDGYHTSYGGTVPAQPGANGQSGGAGGSGGYGGNGSSGYGGGIFVSYGGFDYHHVELHFRQLRRGRRWRSGRIGRGRWCRRLWRYRRLWCEWTVHWKCRRQRGDWRRRRQRRFSRLRRHWRCRRLGPRRRHL